MESQCGKTQWLVAKILFTAKMTPYNRTRVQTLTFLKNKSNIVKVKLISFERINGSRFPRIFSHLLTKPL